MLTVPRPRFTIWLPALAVLGLAIPSTSVRAQQAAQEVRALGVLEEAQEITRSTVIRRSGRYVLTNDLRAEGGVAAIRILASHVTLDLGGHRINGSGNKQGTGIEVSGVTNVRIRHGFLHRLGTGVLLRDTTNVVVEELQIDGEDLGGPPPSIEIGILMINARGSRIERNVITDTFLGIFVRGDGSTGNRIADNQIIGGDNGELAICYNPAPGEATPAGPDGDLIYANLISRFRRGIVLSAGSTGNQVLDNHLAFFDLAIQEGTVDENLIGDNFSRQIPR
jgi:parallel beta-helix repeat protein